MTAHDFTRAQLRHVNALCGSTQMQTFTDAMRLDTPATRWLERAAAYVAANRPTWSRITELQHKCDVGTITATEAMELLELERSQA